MSTEGEICLGLIINAGSRLFSFKLVLGVCVSCVLDGYYIDLDMGEVVFIRY